ncbi:peptidylprolyl isomerase [Calothrix sp. PCC 7507]|uniref:peptidylprolyl isomerase n=1 Tax=Calothrix sp. PCC 7507 TaxID=99598 RepID=UPI00029F0202|nr:peptidylprolyl isomerase [Calothrix sp. PCC 7507]AFY31643.1 PpiC-type peptidyl-prolyl cis-trans isomerase [Calothrix sp. PCC 7507]
MSKSIHVTNEEILEQIKLSCKIPDIVEGILIRKIIENAAAEAGIKIETEELQKTADILRLANKLNSATDTWQWLEQHGLSLDKFEKIVQNTVLSRKLANHLFGNKVEQYFYENQLHFMSAVIYEIVLDDEDLVLELYYAVKEEEMSFYDAARQYIQDIDLRRKRGYLGVVHRQHLKPEISTAVFAAKPPQLLKPIITSKGVHLIFVEEIIQKELDHQLRLQILSDLYNTWLKQQVQQVEVIRHFNLLLQED